MLSDIMELYIGHIKRKYYEIGRMNYEEKLMTYNDIVEKYEQSKH